MKKKLFFLFFAVIMICGLKAQEIITIGTGYYQTSNFPFNTYYHDNRSQMLYLQSEIGTEGFITAIALNVSSYDTQPMNEFTIKMGHSNAVSFVNTSNVITSGLTIVYSGVESIGATGWKVFELQTPFEYNGESSLVVEICFDNTSYASASSVYYTNTSNYKTAYGRADYSSGCSMTMNTITTTRPDIRLYVSPLNDCPKPSNLAVSYSGTNGVTAIWNCMETNPQFVIAYGEKGFNPNQNCLFKDTIGTTQFQFPNTLPTHVAYEFCVRTLCSDGDLSGWQRIAFTAMQEPATLPYHCDFENAAENAKWSFTPAIAPALNNWYISNGIAQNGNKSLYVSDNGGISNHYSDATSSYIYAYRDVYFNVQATSYQITFDWLGFGEYLEVFVGEPRNVSAANNYYGYIPAATLDQTLFLHNAHGWQQASLLLDGSNYGKALRLYFIFVTNNDGNYSQPAPAIDNLTVTPVSCGFPYNLTLANSTTSSLTVQWEAGSADPNTKYQVYYMENIDNMAVESPIYTVTGNEITLTGISPANIICFYIRTICGVGDTTAWSDPHYHFTTDCETITSLPYLENFDGNNIWNCWLRPIGNAYTIFGSDVVSLSNAVQISNKSILVTPQLNLQQDSVILRFMAKHYGNGSPGDSLFVGMMTNPADTSTFIALQKYNLTSAFQEIELPIYFNNLPAGANYIAFSTTRGSGCHCLSVIMDDFKIQEIADCKSPVNITYLPVTSPNGTMQFNFTWEGRNGETSWEIAYGIQGESPMATLTVQNAPSYLLNNLPDNKTMYFRVRALCNGGQSSDFSGDYIFQTPAWNLDFVSFNLPNQILSTINTENKTVTVYTWESNFSTSLVPTFASSNINNWVYINNQLQQSGITAQNFSTPLTYHLWSADSAHHKVWTVNVVQLVEAPHTDSCEITLELIDAWCDGWGNTRLQVLSGGEITGIATLSNGCQLSKKIKVYVGAYYILSPTGMYAEDGFTVIDGMGNAVYQKPVSTEFVFSPPSLLYSGTTICPACKTPKNIAITNILETSADISWTAGGNETQWKLRYKTATATTWTEINNLSVPVYTLTNLVSNTHYIVEVKAVCSASEQSQWTDSKHFNTHVSESDNACSFYGIFHSNGSVPLSNYQMIVVINGDSSYYDFENGSMDYEFYFGAAENANVTLLCRRLGSSGWIGNSGIEFSFYENEGNLLAHMQDIHANMQADISGTMYSSILYGFFNHCSECPKPINPVIDNITFNSARLSWLNYYDNDNWQIIIGENTVDEQTAAPQIVTSFPYILSNLSSKTWYEVKIRSACSDTSFSAWRSIIFQTMQEPIATPFVIDFENAAENVQWDAVENSNSSAGSKWIINNGTQYGGNRALYIATGTSTANQYSTSTAVWTEAWTWRDIYFTPSNFYNLSFYWKCAGNVTDYAEVYIGEIQTPDLTNISYGYLDGYLVPYFFNIIDYSKVTKLGTFNNNSTWTKFTANLNPSAYSGKTQRLYFVWKQAADGLASFNPPMAVDNLQIISTPPMAGIYTIDNTLPTENRNFNTFIDAVNTLNSLGISDSVIFNVTAGQIHNIALNSENGLQIATTGTAEKPVIFQKFGNGNNPKLLVTATSYSTDKLFTLNNLQFITFNGFDIQNAGTSSANYLEQAFSLNTSSNITIKNCNIRLRNASSNYGIYAYNRCDNNLYQNNNITQAAYAYYLYGNSSNCFNNVIDGGLIDSLYSSAIYNDSYASQSNFTVRNLKILGDNNSNYAVYLYLGNNQKIYNNIITGYSVGVCVATNNAADTVYLAHNTVYLQGSNAQYCVYKVYNNSKLVMNNNIFINKTTSSSYGCVYNYGNTHDNILSSSNNNIYYADAGYIYSYYASGYKYIRTAAEYKDLFNNGQESDSWKYNVAFENTVRPYDFHVKTDIPSKAESGGIPVTIPLNVGILINTDIDGNQRDSVTPDCGAYEFDGIRDTTDLSPMAGIYTIDNTLPTAGRNFNTFKTALTVLSERGTSDTVIFNIPAGSVFNLASTADSNRLAINYSGTAEKPIIFRKNGEGANPIFNFTGTSNSNDYAFYLNNMQYITFDGLDIRNAGTTSSNFIEQGFYLNTSSNIIIKNCNIRLRSTSSNYGIYIYNTCNNNLYQNNNITQAYNAYYFYNGNNCYNNMIDGGMLDSLNYHAIYHYYTYQNNYTIKNLKILGNNNSNYAVYLSNGNNQKIYNNVITGYGTGIYVGASNATDTVYLAHNTVYLQGTYAYYCVYKYGNNSKLVMNNSIFINKTTSSSYGCVYNNGSHDNILSSSNNNIYYADAGYIYSYYASGYKYIRNIAEYKDLFNNGQESNSWKWNVAFENTVRPYDFHVKTDIPTKAESGGIPIIIPLNTGNHISTDIDGNQRDFVTPDCGAYEFDGIRDTTDLSPMAGIYTIDNTLQTANRNFNRFKEALNALYERGISDSVVFEIPAGQIHSIAATADSNRLIFNYSGTAEKPITFRKGGEGAKPILNFTGTSSSDNTDYAFILNNMSYITFDGLDIRNAGTSSSNYLEDAFYLNTTSYITIKNCDIRMNNNTGSAYSAVYLYNNNNDFTFENNTITKTYYGIYSGSGTVVNNYFINNIMDSVYHAFYLLNRLNNAIVAANKINGLANSGGYGIGLNQGANLKVYNNVITNFQYGISRSSSYNTDTLYVVNNTIVSSANNIASYNIYEWSGSSPIFLANNINVNRSTSGSSYCFYNANNETVILSGSNNNIYYNNTAKLYRSSTASAGVSTLAEYQTVLADGRENQSHFEMPPFISLTYPYNLNLRTDTITYAESGGLSSLTPAKAGIPPLVDIDGNPRCGATNYDGGGIFPDCGAYEFDGQSYFLQTVCSGATTIAVELGTGQNFNFTLLNTPLYITGYVSSGSNILPAMTLINTSTNNTDTLKYKVTSADLSISYVYTISVKRAMSLAFEDESMFPQNGSSVAAYPVTFQWTSSEDATSYDFYLWNTVNAMPATPVKANYLTNSYTHSSGWAYGNTYKWYVVAKNACNQLSSDTMEFDIRTLPNLHVTNITTSLIDSNLRQFSITWTVKNDGAGATVEPSWTDKIWLMNNIADNNGTYYASNATLLHTASNLQSLNAGESYTNSAVITLPGRWHGSYWLMVATDMSNVYGINWTPAGGTPPQVYQPNVSGTPYPYLFASGYNYSVVEEDGENVNKSDNFFYQKFIVPRPPLQPLIIPAHDTLNFTNRVIMMQDSILLQVTTQDLITPITLTFNGGHADAFSAYFATNWSDSLGGNIVVKFHPEEIGNLSSNLIIAAQNMQKTVYVAGKCILPTMYDPTAQVSQNIYTCNDTITIIGTALYNNGWIAGNVLVRVTVEVLGYTRTLQTETDNNGNYSVHFIPQQGESGYYKIRAFKPGFSSAIKDEFNILGMRLYSGSAIRWDNEVGIPQEGIITIQNRSNVPLHNIQITEIQGLSNANVNFGNIATLPGSGTANISYTITGTAPTTSGNWEEMKWQAASGEGVVFNFSTWFHSKMPVGIIEVNPSNINTLMTKGQAKIVELLVINHGNGPTGKVAVDIPNLEWMHLVSSDTMPSIASGDSAKITLWLAPTESTQLHVPFTGNIAINCANGNYKNIPYTVQAISDSTGNLVVDVVDEYYYNTAEHSHLAGAHVKVTHPYSFVVVAEGYTDNTGHFYANNIPEGWYTLFVDAPNHANYRNNVLIQAGQTFNQFVFISFEAITYSWNVVPTEIEDHYEITLVTTYQTQVPVPVVQVTMPTEMPYLIGEETFDFNMIFTNLGLITALDVDVSFPYDNEYTFDYLMSNFDLPAKTTVVVPVSMRRKDVSNGNAPIFAPMPQFEGSSNPCGGSANTTWIDPCGDKNIQKGNTNYFNYQSRTCGSLGGGYGLLGGGGSSGGGSYGGGGGSSASSQTPTNFIWIDENCCDEQVAENCWLKTKLRLVKIIPIVGEAAYTAAETYTNMIGDLEQGRNYVEVVRDHVIKPQIEGAIVDYFVDESYGKVKEIYELITEEECVQTIRCKLGVAGHAVPLKSHSPQNSPQNAPLSDPIPPIENSSPDNWTYEFDIVNERLSVIATYMKAFTNISLEVYGDTNLMKHKNFNAFIAALEPYISPVQTIPFDDYNILTSGVPDSLFVPFINRWNMTIEANAFGIYVPNQTYPNIINQNVLEVNIDSMIYANNYAVSKGFAGLEAMIQSVKQDMTYLKEDMDDSEQKGVCASVTLQLTQTMTMTREAFRGTLTLHNGNTTTAMTDVHLELEIRDENGVISNDLFEIETESLNVLTEVDGTGSLAANTDGSATILFIPEVGAAPTTTKIYSFGGTLSYTDPFNGQTVTAPLFPVALEVHPSPYLDMYYFWQRDIISDDPFTEPIEPKVPAEIGVMIHNKGYGTAKNVVIESAQPKIIENDKGLLIDFNIIGSSLGSQQRQLGVMDVNFGNIAPHSAKVGHWWLTASLLGHFTSYSANVVHLDSRGNPDLSLVDHIEIHELIHGITAYGNLDDSIPDFLVNDVNDSKHYPDRIYFSNATKTNVYLADTAYCDGNVTPQNLQVNLAVKPNKIGWNYARLNDPSNGRYKLISVVREDGQKIPLTNVWQTFVTMPDDFDPVYENKLHFVDTFSTNTFINYTLIFDPKTANPLKVDSIVGIPEPPVGQLVTIIDHPQDSLTVFFNKKVYQPTFTWRDMELHCQGGANLIDSTIVPMKLNDSTYVIHFQNKTTAFGYYNFIVQTAEIYDNEQLPGEVGKAVQWVQNLMAIDTVLYVTICENDNYYFNGEYINAIGNYYDTLQHVAGGDSLIQLVLSHLPITNYELEITSCDSYTYGYGSSEGEINYTASGTYTHTFVNHYGCDSIVTLNLTINYSDTTEINATICFGETYSENGFTLTPTESGLITNHLSLNTINGCDSIVILNLTVNPTYNTPISETICDNESYDFFGQTLTIAGTYTHLLQTVNSCDSLITLALNVNPTYNTPISETICDNESYDFFGQTLTTTGTYTHLLQTVNSCDSLITLTLNVNPTYNTPISATICDNEGYDFFGQTLTIAGTYTHLLQTVNSCDSLITLALNVNPTYNTPISETICDNESYDFFGQTLTTTGTYTHLLQTVNSCDSLITLTLNVNPTYNTPISSAICDNEGYDFFGQTLTIAGTYTHLLQTVNSCDSLITLTLNVNPTYNTPISATICDNESYDFFGQTLTTAGAYTHLLQTINSCDSLITLTLYVNPTYNTPISETICDNESYSFFGQTLTTAGTYTHLLQTVNSCDSLITLTLYVNPTYNTPISETICDNESYNFFGQTLTSAGIYTHLLQTINSCDSLITLTLNVNPTYNTPISETICDNESYNFFGQSLTTAGIYTHLLQTINSCDSLITLTLNVNPTYNTPISATICDNESYDFFGQSLTTAGTYTHLLQTVNFCDSLITLTLYVNPTYNTPISETICDNESYNFFGQTLTTAGTYTHLLQTTFGCDSIVVLNLQVNSLPEMPGTIEGQTIIVESGLYNYIITTVENAEEYLWTVSNSEWVLNQNGTTATLNIVAGGSGTLSVIAINDCDTSNASTIEITATVGINSPLFALVSQLKVFPNPTNGKISVLCKNLIVEKIQIFDFRGKLVLQPSINTQSEMISINISHLKSGVYSLQFETNEGIIVKKVIKE